MAKKTQINLTRLKKLMERKGWGAGELAQYSGVKYQTVYSIYVGRRTNTSSGTLKQLVAALDTSTDYLLDESDDEAPPIQKLPEPIRQLAEIANQLSGIRQEELLRIAHALHQLEAEQATAPLPSGTMRALIELADKIREQGGNDDLLESLRALFRSPPRGWFLDGLPRGQGPVNPNQSH